MAGRAGIGEDARASMSRLEEKRTMRSERQGKCEPDGRVPFRVYLNPEQLVEICRRRSERTDMRCLADWVEDALATALGDGGKVLPGASRYAREVELFCALVESAPNALKGRWRALYEHVCHGEDYWEFPSGPWQDDSPQGGCTEPWLKKAALLADWPELLDSATKVASLEAGRTSEMSGALPAVSLLRG